ncbi:MAG: aldolase/citrate lyase family protein [Planctomycetota bacterium]|nr:aldolase/citrate lyase family protein [Planctomycetota bacterium]
MNPTELGKAFHEGRQTYGTAVLSPSPTWIQVIPGTGLDFVFIDNEHTPMDREKVAWMCRAYRAIGVVPLVRIPSPDAFWATMALDAGAGGVIAPYIETPEQISALRGAVKCRPLKGRSLQEVLDGSQPISPEREAFFARFNQGNLLVVNIESTPAMENLDALVNSPGLDGVFVGPHDLSISLDVPEDYNHPKQQAAIAEIIRACRKAKVGIGIHLGTEDSIDMQIGWANLGANILVHSSDMTLFTQALRHDFKKFRQATGQSEAAAGGSGDAVV